MRKCVSSCFLNSVHCLDRGTLEPLTCNVFNLNNPKQEVKGAPADSKDSSHLHVSRGFAAAHQLPISCLPRLWRLPPHTSVPCTDKNRILRTGKSHLTYETDVLPCDTREEGKLTLHMHCPYLALDSPTKMQLLVIQVC